MRWLAITSVLGNHNHQSSMAKRNSPDAAQQQQPMVMMGGDRARKRSKPAQTPCFLPADLVGEVLLRLPSKSVARFRCVCRSWARLLSSSGFERSHHAIVASRRPTKFLFAPIAPLHRWILPDENESSSFLMRCEECPRIIGPKPCRGLVLVGRRCQSTFSVCNPSTGGVLHLPPCLTDFPYYDSSAGIGFLEPTGEYKVVVIAEPEDTRPLLRCEVLTVGDPRAGGWRAPTGEKAGSNILAPFHVQAMDPVFSNGCFHWVVGTSSLRTDFDKHYRGVLAFSLATESFGKMPLPPFVTDDIRRLYRHESDPYRENPRKPGYI